MKEFNLSEKIRPIIDSKSNKKYIFEEDVKEFVRRLKEELSHTQDNIIDKLAGDKLIWKK